MCYVIVADNGRLVNRGKGKDFRGVRNGAEYVRKSSVFDLGTIAVGKGSAIKADY